MVSVARVAPSAIDCGFDLDLWSGQSVLAKSVVYVRRCYMGSNSGQDKAC